MTAAGPYALAARTLLDKGWAPLPIRGKWPPLTGWTGYQGVWPSAADVEAWIEDKPGWNVTVRAPRNVLGIDVDEYGDKHGAATIADREATWGALPPTFVSSSKPAPSGIRWYRVPEGLRWPGILGASVEIIHHGDRYGVVAPSIHPNTGDTYLWRDPDGQTCPSPSVEDLPELPAPWVEGLTGGEAATVLAKASDADRDALLRRVLADNRPPCRHVADYWRKIDDELRASPDRHPVMTPNVMGLVRQAERGCPGVSGALAQYRRAFIAAAGADRTEEYDRAVTTAAAKIAADPTPEALRGCWDDLPDLGDLIAPDPRADRPTGPDDLNRLSGPIARRASELRVEEAARRLVRLERAGVRPEASLLDAFLAIPDEPAAYRVADVLPVGGRAVFSAQYKAGKTTAVANLIRALVDAEPFLGQYAVTPFEGRVVLIDDELDARMLRRWLREQNIVNTARVAVLPLRGKVGHFDVIDEANRAHWAAELKALDAGVVILDCLRPVLDALGLNENGEAGIFLTAFDALLAESGAGEAVVTHHMGHSGERSRGDTRIRDWPDVEWKLVREADDQGDQNANARRYFSAYGRDVDVPESLLTYDQTSRRLLIAGGSRKDTAADGVVPDLLDYLTSNPGASQRQIETALGDHTRAMVRAAIGKAVDRGLVTREPGPKNAIRHRISPSAPSAPEVRQRTVSECASAPIGRAAHTHPAEGEFAAAHSLLQQELGAVEIEGAR